MKIKMLESREGSPDGISNVLYETGREYCLPDDLARVFIDEKWAVKACKKDMGSAPENKSAKTGARKPAGRKSGK